MKLLRIAYDYFNCTVNVLNDNGELTFNVTESVFDHREDPGYQYGNRLIAEGFTSHGDAHNWLTEKRKEQGFCEIADLV